MTYLVIVLSVSAVLLVWAALTTCSLAVFVPTVSLRSQLVGPHAYTQLVVALTELPGIRPVERTDGAVLFSVLPTVTSMERGFGMFLVVRRADDGVQLLARPRLPLPFKVGSALRQVEREARMSARTRLPGFGNGGFPA